MLSISLLTPFALLNDGQPITLASRRTEALFIYLLRSRQAQSRDALANLLWDDLPQTRAAGNLRVLIANLRKALGATIKITRQSVWIDDTPGFRCDLTELERIVERVRITGADGLTASAAHALASALSAYHDELLPGFFLRGGQAFDEWLTTEREWIRTRVLLALSDVANAFFRLGDFRDGIEQAQRLVKLDPLREDGHQLLMRLLAADGQASAALAQYQRCTQILDVELGASPSAATEALAKRIGRGELTPPNMQAAAMLGAAPIPIPHNLPREMTPFFGRVAELAQLAQLLGAEANALITVVGAGGMGKTALAIEAARQVLSVTPAGASPFQDGIYLVPLSTIRETGAMPVIIAGIIGLRFQKDDRTELAQLINHVRRQSLLLILDNAEHLPELHEMIEEILRAAPRVRMLVTSRQLLNCAGETALPVQGLDLPAISTNVAEAAAGVQADSSEAILGSSAVQLFIQRVQRARGVHNFSAGDLAAIARVCFLVQGMPLAITLAASSVDVHTFAEIATGIAQGMEFLAVNDGGIPERQRSIHAVFDQTWDLLAPDEQRVLARLSIFPAGCARTVARQVTGATSQQLLALEHKSCIQRDLSTGHFSMHTLLRQWAATKLAAVGDQPQPLHAHAVEVIEQHYASDLWRHAGELAYHAEAARLVAKARDYLRMAGDVARDAFQNSLAIDTYTHALKLTTPGEREAMFQLRLAREELYHLLGNRAEQARELDAMRQLADDMQDIGKQCEVELCRSRYCEAIGQYAQAGSAARAAVGLAEAVADTHRLARAHLAWGAGLRRENLFDDALAHLQTAVNLAEVAALPTLAADGLRNMGIIAAYQGDYTRAQGYFERNLGIYRQAGNLPGEAAATGNLGVLLLYLADYARARPFVEQSVEIFRRIRDRRREAIGLNNLGTIAHKQGDYAAAQACYEQTLIISHQINDLQSRREAHNLLGHVLIDQAQIGAAKQHYEAALQLAHELNAPGSAVESQSGLAAIALLEGNNADACAQADGLLPNVNEHTLAQVEDGLRVYLACHRILRACSDERGDALIAAAHRILQERASRIVDASLRRSFLANNPIHRQVVAEFEAIRLANYLQKESRA